MTSDFRRRFGADTRDCARWPYPFGVYVRRVLWWLVWYTVWQACWKRIPFLRCGLLRLFGARTTLHAHIARSAWIEMPWNLSLGEYSAIGGEAKIYNLARIELGDNVVVSQGAHLCAGTHDFSDPTYPLVMKPIRVEAYAWIAAEAFVLPDVTIGEGAVVGARAVVTKDVAPWTIVAGNPARKIGDRAMHAAAGGAIANVK